MLKIETGEQNSILRKKCDLVIKFDKELTKIVVEMEETMLGPDEENNVTGVGLAANQVGILKRIILVTFNVSTKKKQKIMPMINPEIIEESTQKCFQEEGCLSLPKRFENVSRSVKVKVKWQNLKGNWCEKKLDKWDARIFLHEYDHLEGILFTDYVEQSTVLIN